MIFHASQIIGKKIKEVDTISYQLVRPKFFLPAVLEYTGRFGCKREIWPVQKLKGKIEEMHDLNKLQCSKLPPHWHRRLDLLLPFFFFFYFFLFVVLLHCSDFFSFLLNNEHCYVVSLSLSCILFEFFFFFFIKRELISKHKSYTAILGMLLAQRLT